jgi:nucleotide-binding universal stress UspA family protein
MNSKEHEPANPLSQKNTDLYFRMQRILVPIDFTPAALHALRCAARMAERFQGSVCLVHVIDCGLYNEVEHSALIKANAEVSAEAASQLDELAVAELGQIPHTKLVLSGNPAEEIVKTAQSENSDVIIMVQHEYKLLDRIFHRHTLRAVESAAHCPVLTLHCDEAGEITPKLWKGTAKSRVGEWVGKVFLNAFGTPSD